MYLYPAYYYLYFHHHHFKHANLRPIDQPIFKRHFFLNEQKYPHQDFWPKRKNTLSPYLAVLLSGSA